ncbi:hypothetical protein BT63DRAFT_460715 [Microthyrium microscopicum]|uniref:F-box domain-containing protein n=1 Tax=Microthyrium microscopicum TaxID=703497 RepID=A0A6A6TY64_9PEZI|nr:hypothetical protein BT63DRAFT_460715 [Microthyrium microscopicum]
MNMNDIPRPLSFLSLPPETRNSIYELALISQHQPLAICAHITVVNNEPAKRPSFAGSIALLRANQQIHWEASKILYSKNTFYFTDIDPKCSTNCIWSCRYRLWIERVQFDQWLAYDFRMFNQRITRQNAVLVQIQNALPGIYPYQVDHNGVPSFPGIEILKILPNLRYIDILFSRRFSALDPDQKDYVLIPFMTQLIRWLRRYPRIVLSNRTEWLQLINRHIPLHITIVPPTREIHFLLWDSSPEIRRLVEQFADSVETPRKRHNINYYRLS